MKVKLLRSNSNGNETMRCLLTMFLISLLLTSTAMGHKAPSGWLYPTDCCAGEDCRPISCSTVIDRPDGSVNWTGIHFNKEQVKMSGDASCHVCVSYTQVNGTPVRNPHCIYLSPTN